MYRYYITSKRTFYRTAPNICSGRPWKSWYNLYPIRRAPVRISGRITSRQFHAKTSQSFFFLTLFRKVLCSLAVSVVVLYLGLIPGRCMVGILIQSWESTILLITSLCIDKMTILSQPQSDDLSMRKQNPTSDGCLTQDNILLLHGSTRPRLLQRFAQIIRLYLSDKSSLTR